MTDVVIYKVESPSGKIYIGKTHNYRSRLAHHKCLKYKKPILLKESILEYGYEKHIFSILYLFPKDVSDSVMNEYERIYINAYKNCGINMLNIKEGGDYGKNAASTILKMKESVRKRDMRYRLGMKNSEEHNMKIGAANKIKLMGRINGPRSQETKEKIIEGMKKYWKARKDFNTKP